MESALKQARETIGLSARQVGELAGVDPTGLARIESGRHRPARETASTLFGFYGEIVPLGMIYDPHHPIFDGYWTDAKKKKLRGHFRDRGII